MRCVVTGGAGFIGANLVRRLLQEPEIESIVVVDDLSSGSRENLAGLDRTQLLEGTILDAELLDQAFAGADAVVHLAARPSVSRSIEDPVASHEANVTGTLRVLEALRRAGGLYTVVASSSSVYGSNPTLPKHEGLVAQPVSPYAASKLAAESYALSYAHCFGLPVLVFRFFNVFGPLQPAGHAYAAVIPAFVSAALAGRPLPVHGDGRQTRDFTYVGSVTAVIADAVRRRVTSDGPVNLAFGSRRSLLAAIAELERVLGHAVEIRHTAPRPGDVRDSQADQTRLHELFPDIEPFGFIEGLRATVEWLGQLDGRAEPHRLMSRTPGLH
ncbi:MAG: NAD-dependent epimerase/dehydratase family protein [Egibacteraceae bacterium]